MIAFRLLAIGALISAGAARANEADFAAGKTKQCVECKLVDQRFKGRDLTGADLSRAALAGATTSPFLPTRVISPPSTKNAADSIAGPPSPGINRAPS